MCACNKAIYCNPLALRVPLKYFFQVYLLRHSLVLMKGTLPVVNRDDCGLKVDGCGFKMKLEHGTMHLF